MATPNPAAPGEDRSRRILITQCLQNDLFLNPDCRLYLSDSAVKQLLVATAAQSSAWAGLVDAGGTVDQAAAIRAAAAP